MSSPAQGDWNGLQDQRAAALLAEVRRRHLAHGVSERLRLVAQDVQLLLLKRKEVSRPNEVVAASPPDPAKDASAIDSSKADPELGVSPPPPPKAPAQAVRRPTPPPKAPAQAVRRPTPSPKAPAQATCHTHDTMV
eukprot:s611_g2.t1